MQTSQSSMRRVNVILTVRQYEVLKAKAQLTGESMATIIRQAVDASLKEKGT